MTPRDNSVNPATAMQVVVPNVSNMPVETAVATLRAANLAVMIVVGNCMGPTSPKRAPKDNRKTKGQCSAAGATVPPGSVVSIVVTEP